ncbi:hypothetical protein ABMA28_010511 [Loxostege sticticalis]|uniref:PHD-type domain-containing protein n=1 Tax=Loxostege sticticalis TaxID=481309 RepID=A0ABD0S920_LOXSC
MICRACNNSVSKDDLIRCNPCKGTFHYRCLNMTSAYFTANRSNLTATWYCPSCANITRRKGPDTPVGKHFVPQLNETTMSCDESFVEDSSSAAEHSRPCIYTLPATQTATSSNGMTYVEFLSLLDSKLDAKLDEKFDTFRTSVNKMIQSQITSAIENLKTDFTHTTDFLADEQQLDVMERRINSVEKVSRSRNLEIQAIPDRRNEDLVAIVRKICDTINVPVHDVDICSVRRIAKFNPDSSRPRNILLTLPSERQRDIILSAYKRYNKHHRSDPLNTGLLGIPGEKVNIYLAEHLSAECRELYAAARKFSRDHSFKYVWVKYGRVYLRKDDSSSAIFVKDLPNLGRLKKT